MDKTWIEASRTSKTYRDGVQSFIDFGHINAVRDEIKCPCLNCCNLKRLNIDLVHHHILLSGFLPDYTIWTFHGEQQTSSLHDAHFISGLHHRNTSGDETSTNVDDITRLLRDALGFNSLGRDREGPDIVGEDANIGQHDEEFDDDFDERIQSNPLPTVDPIRYQKILEECDTELYPVDAGENDGQLVGRSPSDIKKKAAEVLRYFPLILRLKRIYMSTDIAEDMRWHEEGGNKDGLLRHPADGKAWKEFDVHYPEFAAFPRSIRLGLASDGFNPFRTMSTTYSIWLVMLIPYNLPHGNELWAGIDAYDAFAKENFKLQAALMWTINDLLAYAILSGWSTKGRIGCPVCTDSTCSIWLKHGRKFSYMGHRRWLKQGHPSRLEKDRFDGTYENKCPPKLLSDTDVLKQLNGAKFTYGKPAKHLKKRPRENTKNSSSVEEEINESILRAERVGVFENGDNIFEEDVNGKPNLWKKRSIFFDLPYWQYNLLRHNLDVMHIEKNVCDNLFGTLLNLDGKTKDNEKARKDLMEMGIRCDLHLVECRNTKPYLPPACYTMSKTEKSMFLQVLKDLKVPDGYASNISRGVHL
ncbi:uncharacterized protein [Rutidosis leptorrhynchoides]|uniref:uncharacterized protein n=1 Tax=Rutidosis leptorrhynchoides TaxID=125765 RepID=UPI003A991943